MDDNSPPRWVVAATAFIAVGTLCAGCFLTSPGWIHLLPNLPARAVRVPTVALLPTVTPTAFVVVLPTSLPTSFPTPTPGRTFAPVERPISRPVIRSQGGNPAACIFVLLVLGGIIAIAVYFANKTGPARSPAGATLPQRVEYYMKKGFRIIQQTETAAQLVRPKQFDVLLAIILFFIFPLIGLVIYLLYFIGQRDTTLYLQIVEGRVTETRG